MAQQARSSVADRLAQFPSWQVVIAVVTAYVCAWCGAEYLRFQPAAIVRFGLFALLLAALWLRVNRPRLQRREGVTFGIFSNLFALMLVLGYHIQITGSMYSGTMEDNYISGYGIGDLGAFILLAIAGYVLFTALYQLVFGTHQGVASLVRRDATKSLPDLSPVGIKPVLLMSALLLVCWLPYLFIYWPGFIFGDTVVSLSQLQTGNFTNHHPVVFTWLIGLFMKVAGALGFGNTVGVAFYTFFQMCCMALGLGYVVAWIRRRACLRPWLVAVIVCVLGLSPYVATYSVALWKDPIFSVALVVACVMLADYAFTKGSIVRGNHGWLPVFCGVTLVYALFRNNGFYIAVGLWVCLLAFFLWNRRENRGVQLATLGATLACVVFVKVLTGPVYTALGVQPSPTVESAGIMLNQMARVAALDGDMSPSDRVYMNELLPLDKYAETYRPVVVDLLKWDDSFNAAPLDDGLFKHWFSMLVRNPRVYFEAWELETFGYWACNVPGLYTYARNVAGGIPRNLFSEWIGQV